MDPPPPLPPPQTCKNVPSVSNMQNYKRQNSFQNIMTLIILRVVSVLVPLRDEHLQNINIYYRTIVSDV